MPISIDEYLHILKQLTDPINPLIDSAQVYMDSNKDLCVNIHDEKDPGLVLKFQLADFDGYIIIPTGNQAIDLLLSHFFKSTPTDDATWTTTSERQGHFIWLHVDNTAGKTITFGTGFTDVSAISESGIQNKILYYDGDTWREIATGGSGSMPALPENQTFRGNASNEAEATDIIQVESDGEVVITLGDNAGVKKFTIKDSDGAVLLTIDSNGFIDGTAITWADGTVAHLLNGTRGEGEPPNIVTVPEGTVFFRLAPE